VVSREYPLADVGEGLTEAELVRWLVAVGDTVKVNDPVCEVETAKSVVELPSPYAGVVEALLVEEGATIPVGTPLLRIGDGATPADESPSHAEGSPSPAEGSPGHATEQPLTLVGSGPKEQSVARRARLRDHSPGLGDLSPGSGGPSRVLAKPGARLAARERGIDLSSVPASREDGVVTAADLEELAGAGAASGGVREPVRGVRKAMAQAMTASHQVPQVTVWTSVDATRTLELVERLKARRDFDGVRVGPLLVVAKACLLALRRTPLLNSTYADEEVVYHDEVNLGIAAATPRGLVVPHVKAADRLDLVALATAINGLVGTARDGRTQPAEQIGGTFTITNVGPFGIEGGTPLLNPGESGILCLGTIARRPWVVGEEVLARPVVTLALTFDHRHVDGETGSRFLADVAAIVEDPGTALLF
jgi:2-oxoisovalerate dehydrogenase E2 component (dihydrolipoyl transacylase)